MKFTAAVLLGLAASSTASTWFGKAGMSFIAFPSVLILCGPQTSLNTLSIGKDVQSLREIIEAFLAMKRAL